MSVFLEVGWSKNPTIVKRQNTLQLKSMKTYPCIRVTAMKRTFTGKELY